jgi:hypothetical protein
MIVSQKPHPEIVSDLYEPMYSHILLTTWPRGSGPEPTTAASSSDGIVNLADPGRLFAALLG